MSSAPARSVCSLRSSSESRAGSSRLQWDQGLASHGAPSGRNTAAVFNDHRQRSRLFNDEHPNISPGFTLLLSTYHAPHPIPPVLPVLDPRSSPIPQTSSPSSCHRSSRGRRLTRGRGKGLVCSAPSVLLLPTPPHLLTLTHTHTHRAQHQQSWQRNSSNNKPRKCNAQSSLPSCLPLHQGLCQP
ncbi:hypothetical protein XELAEV_18020662mg [Xenopus laevis]|uniref:Uncharacterized protein n=1 Tax=Xenopus laevis TaxID=8355 RepID=A0A974HQN3_XENLA|nr:hypothetical protein XELAEV_18020662mg [Xenopus laevis]